MSNYIGAIDQGTTSTRFIVFDRRGRIVSVAQKEHEQIYPQPGWVEHDASEIWRRTEEVIEEAMQQQRPPPGDLAAIGITNQRETTVLWDRKTGSRSTTRWSGRTPASARTLPTSRATADPTAFAPRPACRWPLTSAA